MIAFTRVDIITLKFVAIGTLIAVNILILNSISLGFKLKKIIIEMETLNKFFKNL